MHPGLHHAADGLKYVHEQRGSGAVESGLQAPAHAFGEGVSGDPSSHPFAKEAKGRSTQDIRDARILPREFYNRDPVTVGRDLLGKLLIRRDGRKMLAGRIVEDEAYLGAQDPAAHAYSGRTPRNAVLFGPPGHAYVYFIYGNHYCLNVSCMPEGDAEGVLLRAMEPVAGIEQMARARGMHVPILAPTKGARMGRSNADSLLRPSQLRLISSGPGRMSEALGITRARDNAKDLTSRRSDLWFADDGYRPERIVATPRIGIRKAVEEPLRFVIAGNSYVSGRRTS
jgi:DNA-3-methyladenine glycosylase